MKEILFSVPKITLLSSLYHGRSSRDRDVLPQKPYVFPPPDVSEIDQDSFSVRLKEDDRDIVRSLAVGSFLGGMYAEYICRESGTQKEILAKDADPVRIYQAIHNLLDTVSTVKNPVITASGCHPLHIEGEILKGPFGSFNEALAEFYPQQAREVKVSRPKIPKEERIRMQQLASISKFEKNIKKNEEQVAKIYEEYQYVQEVITTLSKASEHRSWQEIADILKKDTTGAGRKILSVNPAEASVDLDLSGTVTIHVNETIDQNAGRYYDQIKKFKRKLAGAKVAMEKVIVRSERKADGYVRPKKKWFYRFRWFYTSDNVLVIGGKDAGQNEELVKRYMEGKDFFVHADVHGASVVIVKGETECWDEVARFAASYSGGWRAGHFTVDVYAAASDQVSKTAESGEFLSRGSFVVRGERRWFRDVPLGVAIGLAKKPVTMIIGGPLTAVQGRSDLIIQIQPGGFEPNDIAKRIVRTMREKLSPADQKALKFALNTEAYCRVCSPWWI